MILDTIPAGAAKRRVRRRRDIEYLLGLAEYLATDDRLFVRHIFDSGIPASHIARIAGQTPRTMQKRLERIVDRLNDPLFRFVVGHGDLPGRTTHEVARLVVCEGLSMRQAADHLGLTLHQVRQHMHAVRTRAGW